MLRKRIAFVVSWEIVIAGLFSLIFPLLAQGEMSGMGHGMMGMNQSPGESSSTAVNSARAKALLTYLHTQNLQCLQCHAVSNAGMGPAFALVATKYAHHKDAEQILEKHIAHGIGNMPQGLASETQAVQIAKLILKLEESE